MRKNTEFFRTFAKTAGEAVAELNRDIKGFFGDDMWRVLNVSHNVVYNVEAEAFEATAIVLYEDKTPEEEGEKSDNVKALEAAIR